MSFIHPSPTHLIPASFKTVMFANGSGGVMLSGTSFIGIDKPVEARLLAVQLLELANSVEAAQRSKEAAV